MKDKKRFIVGAGDCPQCNDGTGVEPMFWEFPTKKLAEEFIQDLKRKFPKICIARDYDAPTTNPTDLH